MSARQRDNKPGKEAKDRSTDLRCLSTSLGVTQREKGILAVLCSDIHLRHKAPLWRSCEPDWYAAQRRVITQLMDLQLEYCCPIIVAGDLFHHWSPPPQLINFAIKYLPRLYAIPGQHDLPLHNYEDMEKSAFWTLVECNKVTLIKPGETTIIPGVVLHGFPWGHKVKSWKGGSIDPFGYRMAVVHAYIWKENNSYPGSPESANISAWEKKLFGYDHAVFGDNHKGFYHKGKETRILNCGGLMRTKSDEIDYKPSVGLLHIDGKITRKFLDVSEDKYLSEKEIKKASVEEKLDIKEFLKELSQLDKEDDLDFPEALRRYLDFKQVDTGVRKVIIQVLEGKK